jgi:guanosine-3',5'-bis(diphosphate) 3'-pyrophosphohydrolase
VNRPPFQPTTAAADDDRLAGLLHTLAGTRPDANAGLIRRAYDVAAYWHQDQRRKSGDPYITHPLAVATILAGIGADDPTLCAALLHDTIEDTPYTLAAMNTEFGSEIAGLVTGATALDAVASGDIASGDAGSAMAVAASGDARILVIKLADRLHNMRTLRHLPPATQVQKSRQTLEVLVPLARRLGLEAITSELENIASGALKRYGQRAVTASGRMLASTTVLLPAAVRARWREEWLSELCVLPTRRERVTFAVQTMLGIPRLTVTLRRSPAGSDRARRP